MLDPQLLGFLIGDGWRYNDCHRNYLLGFTQSVRNSEIMNHYRHMMAQLGKVYQKYRRRKNAYDIYIKNKQLFNAFGEYAANPAELFKRLTKEEKRKFVTGFVDAEASVTVERCRIYNSNHSLLIKIQRYLKVEVGIHAILYRDKRVWVLEIKHSNLRNFYSLINSCSIKVNRLLTHAPYTRV